jgi:hypothetical protein
MEAMKVELACLADTKTFALSLQIVTTPNGVELRGQVPDEATREHVLRLARQASYAPVQDRLTLVEPCADPALREAARVAVSRALASRDASVRVQVLQKGVVSLVGQVENLEDKLNASRSLRATSGCTRVENHLQVRLAGVVAQPSDAASAESQRPLPDKVTVVKAEEATPAPTRMNMTEAETLNLPMPRAQILPTSPAPQYVRIRVRPDSPEASLKTPPTLTAHGYTQTLSMKPTGLPGFPGGMTQAGGVHTAAEVSPPPTLLGQFRAMMRGQATERGAPVITEVRVTPTPRATTTVVTTPVVTTPVVTSAKVSPAPVRPSPGITVPSAAPETWPAAHAAKEVAEVPTPVASPAVAAEASAAVTTARKVVAPEAVQTPQVVSAPAPVQAAPMPVSSTRVLTAEQMRTIIRQGCGRLCREVKVTARADGQPVFHVYASVKVEQELTGKLLTIPEVVSSNAHIQIHLE